MPAAEYGRGAVNLVGRRAVRLDLVVPLTREAYIRGLQGFKLGQRQGMAFLSSTYPAEESLELWMAAVRYPLAMIWVSKGGRVAAIETPRPGDTRIYRHRGAAVIEIHQALAEELGLDAHSAARLTVEAPC
jgi:uncharacterized membrane protein (UPF0127 family)